MSDEIEEATSINEVVQRPFTEDVKEVQRNAWKPVSEPPTKGDADSRGFVFYMDDGRPIDITHWQVVRAYAGNPLSGTWARISDVLLMPPQGR